MAPSLRRSVSWTLAGRCVYALCQWSMLLVIARMGGLEAVGRFALALAVTGPIVLFSNLGLRHIQATDAEGAYTYTDYLAVRACTTALALLAIAGLLLVVDYAPETVWVIGLVGLAKASESMSDVAYGLEQRHRRVDLTTRSLVLRGVAGVLAMTAAYWASGQLIVAVAAMSAAWVAVYLGHDLAAERRLLADRAQVALPPVRRPGPPPTPLTRRLRLTRLALPMGTVALLISLNVNVPRYFIEAWLGEEVLGAFAAIFYFVVIGTLVVNSLGQVALVELAEYHARGQAPPFRRLLARIVGASAALGLVGVLVSWLCGPQLIAALYGPAFVRGGDIFVWMMIAGGLSYVASSLFYGVTARRIFTGQAVLYAVVALINVGACALWIGPHGVFGAIWAWIAALLVQIALSLWLVARARPQAREDPP